MIDACAMTSLKRKCNDKDEEGHSPKYRRNDEAQQVSCSPDSTEKVPAPNCRIKGGLSRNIEESTNSKILHTAIATSHQHDRVLSPTQQLPRTGDDRADADSTHGVVHGSGLPCAGGSSRVGVESNTSLRGEHEAEGSLARLLQQRFPWSHRDLPMTRSAFREVCKDKPQPANNQTALFSQNLPLKPYLLNDQLYSRSIFQPKLGKPFAGLSDIDVGREVGGDGHQGGLLAATQPIIQPLHESRAGHFTLAQLATSSPRHATSEMFRMGTYLPPQQSLLQGRTDISLSAKRTHDQARYIERTLLPLRKYLNNTGTNNRNNVASNISPYMALPGLMLTTASPPVWQPPSLGMLAMPTENWCARCKTSFRMTSDLVYHMRTCHRRGSMATSGSSGSGGGGGSGDVAGEMSGGCGEHGGRNSGNEKTLRCHVCRETFRERHHLTRHMTSHIR